MRHIKRLLKVPTQSFFLLGPLGVVGLFITLLSMSGLYADHQEKKMQTSAYLRLFFDEKDQPEKQLSQLLEIVGMETQKGSVATLTGINAWAQKNLLRRAERWNEQVEDFEKLKSIIKPLLKDLGFVDAVSPRFIKYQGAIVHGALLDRVRIRLHHLIEQWKQGVRFTDLYFLSGERPLHEEYENREALIKKGGQEPLEFPKTECEMIQFLWQQSDVPEEMRRQVRVYFINAPMKKDPITGSLVRPTTDDTVKEWLKLSPSPGCYLAVTNAPYIVRQDLVMWTNVYPSLDYTFDTIGSAASAQEKMAIFLDELARTLFQIHQLEQQTEHQ